MSQDQSFYSNDQQYFLDMCRANDMEELKQFISQLPENSQFNWGWFNNKGDNFMHMLAANNLHSLFDYLMPIVVARCPKDQVSEILNRQNSNNSTPLHYAVVTDSIDMVKKLLEAGADPQLKNQSDRTAFQQAEKFQKYQIAEILAPVTKTDIQALRKQVGDMKLDDSSDEQQEELPTIQQKKQDKQEKVQIKSKQNTEIVQQKQVKGKQKAQQIQNSN